MRLKSILLLVSLAAASVALGDVNLTPNAASINMGGFFLHRLQFVDGDKKYCMTLDSDAEVSAATGGTQVRFKGIPGASVSFVASPLKPTLTFDGENLVRYQRAAAGLLPASAESVVQDEAVSSPESIGGGASYRFVFSYKIAGVPMRESIMFVNISAGQQIVVKAGSFLKDFEAASSRAVNMIRDWHLLRPAEEQGLN
jgi:hypothetical protein